ncbi:HipA N-terminal domain-containing protein [Azotobacter vinelandii]|uniref:HipA N-terminal domain-containing protein n=1 Tax=Azotobacter vinelandii TaxID=354 RepID=UPI0026654EE3|nr:HipA N-terminal domain-containing protein [Azotobacter vinelandii]WKN21249.1 HipA N-terminal domain-containing protein [Azotobacter vinelandii]
MAIDEGLPVTLDNRLVGRLARSDADWRDTRFRYETATDPRDAVSLPMPVRGDEYPWPRGVHPVFEMNLPEGYLRHNLARMFSKAIRGFDDYDLLEIVGLFQLGRLGVGAIPEQGMPDISIGELLLHDGAEGLFDDLMAKYARYSGISGVQPKVLRESPPPTERRRPGPAQSPGRRPTKLNTSTSRISAPVATCCQ